MRALGRCSAILGVLGLIAGLVVLRHPGNSLLAVLLVLGIWLVVSGVVALIRALANRMQRAQRLLVALVDIVLGILVLSLPELSIKTVAVLTGCAFIVRGVLTLWTGLHIRRTGAATPEVAAA